MPAFQAINLDPEENVDELIDTTKELQVDEALKRFQNALKLQAQGVRSREAAGVAYNELFESEIFKYREARTDYERVELQTSGQPEVAAPGISSEGLDVGAGGADGVAANLSLALYLSYKNYGLYFLDRLKDAFEADPAWHDKRRVSYDRDGGDKILNNWAAALDQDPSDPELWRKAARLAAAMNSGRLKRYCLEAAIELDDDPAVEEVEPPSLAESLAGEQLKDFLQHLGDDLALSHPVMLPWLRKSMPALIKRHLDPFPFLPDPTSRLTSLDLAALTTNGELPMDEDTTFSIEEPLGRTIASWTDLGRELVKCADDTSGALQACESLLRANLPAEGAAEEVEPGAKSPGHASPFPLDVDKASETEKPEKHGTRKPLVTSRPEPKEGVTGEAPVVSARKRSQSVAGLPETQEEETVAEKRSKRVRRRVETAHAEEHTDSGTLIANQLRHCQEADQRLFHITKNLLETIGVQDREAFQHLDEILDLCVAEDRTSKTTRLIAKDMRSVIADFNADTAMVLLNKKEKATLGLSSFLEHAKSGSQDRIATAPFNEVKGLGEFAARMVEKRDQQTSQDIALEWLRAICPSYTETRWSEAMKATVIQVLNSIDPLLYEMTRLELEKPSVSLMEGLAGFDLIIPMLLELRVEIYERVTNQSSAEDYATRMDAKYRLDRWLDISSLFVSLLDRPATDSVCVRLMWASIMASSLSDDPVREHILLLWTSLRDFLTKEDVKPLHLPNNLIMPTISSAAADREISKLTTMDFFLSLFQEGMEDPVHVIETLEPVLNPSSVYVMDTDTDADGGRAPSPGASEASTEIEGEQDKENENEKEKRRAVSDCANQGMRDLWNFLRSSSTELRLFLWSRLGDAYEAIGYSTKRFSCQLRSIEIIVSDLEGEKYASLLDESRRLLFMRTLKSLDELFIQSLTTALNDTSAFDIIDDDHLESSASALAKISCLLHVGVLCEDEVRIGVKTAPGSNSATFQSLIHKLREMQVRAWCLQYVTFRASLPLQDSLAPDKDLADFLAAIHQVIGLRKGCKVSNKVLLKVMRMELLKYKNIENWEDHLGQVVYDLYGLKIGKVGAGLTDFQDHGCPPEKLEKRQTMQLVEKVMILANQMPMKDLLKSDLKNTIEHMQQTIGQPVSTPQMIHNLRNFTEQLKKPIHPLRLYQALHGGVSVDAVTVKTPEAILAKHGWFFLLGMIALSKFKAVDLNRRQTPGATDDLRIGATFLRLQLQFTADRWEAWFRLAECFDYELDEAVLWTADKMNKDRPELVKFQRNAIHCYTLALSHSRHQETSGNDGDALHDLYHKFGMRLYASSREPFAMEPFQHADHERFFIERVGCGTFKRILHEEMSEYKVWKFAAKMFRMAMERDPGNWKNAYMLAKCYWKMHQTPVEKLQTTDRKSRITTETLLDSLRQAIDVAYHARKSRHSDPILEPHYKLVSVLHKLVTRGQMPGDKAAALLSEQPFGVSVAEADDDAATGSEQLKAWIACVIKNLAKLKEKDKSNWQHRIVARHAQIVFGDDGDDDSDSVRGAEDLKADAKAAFGILRENMFTKTMVMNVWKCDAERPGRHHVFTEQYVRFMTRILVTMSDRANLEQLLRRLRKKGADFYHFTDLWQSCCNAYLRLLRQEHNIPPLADESFKAITTEDFETVSERITEWAAGDEAETPAFLCMKEAIELKKLNANLIKVAVIDDLINDCYCKIYIDVASSLSGIESVLPQTPPLEAIKNPVDETEEGQKAHNENQEELEEVQHPAPEKPHRDGDGDGQRPTAQLSSSFLNPTVSSTQDNNNNLAGSATPLPDADKSETAPNKVRKTGVRRADILRKAEQAVVRSMEMPKQLLAHGGRSRVGSLSSNKRGSQTPVAGGSDADSDDEGPERQVRREAGEDVDGDAEDTQVHRVDHDGDGDGLEDSKLLEDQTELESEAGSIHDDADDESDLSDVPEGYDDDVPPGLLFPGLLLGRAVPSAETSGVDADSESEGDDPEEPEEDEELRVAAAGDDKVLIQRRTEDRDHGLAEDERRSADGDGAGDGDGDGDGGGEGPGDIEMRDAELTFSAEDTIEIGQ